MATAATSASRLLARVLVQTAGVLSHGIVPGWAPHLIASLGDILCLLDYVVTMGMQPMPHLHEWARWLQQECFVLTGAATFRSEAYLDAVGRMQVDEAQAAQQVIILRHEIQSLTGTLPVWLARMEPEHAEEASMLLESLCGELGRVEEDYDEPILVYLREQLADVRPNAADVVRQMYPVPIDD